MTAYVCTMRVASHGVTTAAAETSVDARTGRPLNRGFQCFRKYRGVCERVTLCIESVDDEDDDRIDPWRGDSELRSDLCQTS